MINDIIKTNLDKIADFVKEQLKISLANQGHNLTGSLMNSIDYVVTVNKDAMIYGFEMLDYGIIVNRGVKANKIPYSGSTGRGGTSKYIEALIAYGKKRNVDNAISFAFAVAATHKREGMPTQASSRFSRSGRRTMFIAEVIIEMEKQIPSLIERYLFEKIDSYFVEIV
jgi:hypothetical protein